MLRALWIALVYALLAAIWISGSHALLAHLPDATFKTVSLMNGLVFVATTSVTLYIVLLIDERRRQLAVNALQIANERLSASEADLRAVIDNLPEAFYRIASDGRITFMSKAGHEMLGWDEGELVGRQMSTFYVEPGGRDRFLTAMRYGRGQVRGYEAQFRRKDGRIIWCSINARFTHDQAGDVIGIEGISRDVTELKNLETQLRHLARHDSLTGLVNRMVLMEHAHHALARARRNGTPVGLLFLDLDGFKEINDGLGHHVGDAVLVAVAERIRRQLRETDVAARLGGDEFVVLLDGDPDEGAVAVARRIIEALRQPFTIEDNILHLSTSIGIALFPDHGDNAEGLLRRADEAMYLAKAGGKDRYALAATQNAQSSAD